MLMLASVMAVNMRAILKAVGNTPLIAKAVK